MQPLKFDRNRKAAKVCPCGRSNKDGKFAPYIGHENCGFCHSCNEVFLPKLDGSQSDRATPQYESNAEPPPASYIAAHIVPQTMKYYEINNFIQFLSTYFKDEKVVSDLAQRFRIGTAKGGKTVFWQIDTVGLVRSGQVILYNPNNGKRNKSVMVGWAHTNLKLENFVLRQCFFGEHQLMTERLTKPIAIVESPKTAVIMAAIDKRFIWLASCGAAGLQPRKFKELEHRHIFLFPDLGKYDEWNTKALELTEIGMTIKVDSILEQYIQTLPEHETKTHIQRGYDIADFAIQFDWYAKVK